MIVSRILETIDRVVCIRDIPTDPGPFCMSFGFESALLMNSISRIGMIHRPLLLEKAFGLEIVTGFQRILAARTLGWSEIPCKVLKKDDYTGLECILLNLHDNLTVRRFNEVEKGMILSRLSNWVSKDDLVKTYMPLLGLPIRESTLRLYLGLEKSLENEIKMSLVKGRVSLRTVTALLEMNPTARSSIHHAMNRLGLNQNQQRNLLDLVLDLSHQRNLSVPEVLRQPGLQRIFDNKDLNTPQKATAVIRGMREELFPRLTRAEKSFCEKLAAIKPPENIRITYPSYFEGSHYQMTVNFKNGADLLSKIREMLCREKALIELSDPGEEDH